jgi:hypothetical protein
MGGFDHSRETAADQERGCFYGFTRFAAPTSADGELEDIQLAV